MCNVAVATSIIEILSQKVLDGDVFTAFDVTSAVRAAMTDDDTVLHNDVRTIVRNEFETQQMQGYNRELCPLNTISLSQAFVYFPNTKQASDHPLVSSSSVVLADANDAAADVDDVDDDDTVVDLADDEIKTTKEGRVQIPRKLLDKVSPKGGSFDILISGTLKCAPKDARGDVRIGLRQFGIRDNKVRVIVDTGNNTINIETV